MYDDRRTITVASRGWEELPDGGWQLLIECSTIVEFVTLPKTLVFGDKRYDRVTWESKRKVAVYREDWNDFIKEQVRLLM